MRWKKRLTCLFVASLVAAGVLAADNEGTAKTSGKAHDIVKKRRLPLKSWELCLTKVAIERERNADFSYALTYDERLPANPLLPDVRPASKTPRPEWIEPLEFSASELAKKAGQGDWASFKSTCMAGKEKEAKALYESMQIGCWYWKVKPLVVARNRKDRQLAAVELQAHPDFGKPVVKSFSETMDFLNGHGKNRNYYVENLVHGYRQLIFFRWDDGKKVWVADPAHADKSLNDMMRDDLFYSHIRKKMWGEYDKMNDFSKPFDYKFFYTENSHFTLEDGVRLERDARVVRGSADSRELSRQERFLQSVKPYGFEDFTYGIDWDGKYSRAEMESFLAQVNKANNKSMALYNVLAGKKRLRALVGEHSLKLFKKPVELTADVKFLDGSLDNGALLLGHVMSDFAGKYYDAQSRQHWDDRQKQAGDDAKRKLEKLGLLSLQLHGYQEVTFADRDIVFVFGLITNPKQGEDSVQQRFSATYAKTKDGAWSAREFVVEQQMATRLFSTGIGYSSLLDSYFDDIGGQPFYRDLKVSGKQYHDRLKKLGIYDIFRIRKPEECTPYEKGLDHTKLATWTLEEIEKAE